MNLSMIFKLNGGGVYLLNWYQCMDASIVQECGTVISGTELFKATMLEF